MFDPTPIITEALEDGEVVIPVASIIPVMENYSIYRRAVLAPCGHALCTIAYNKEQNLPFLEMSLN